MRKSGLILPQKQRNKNYLKKKKKISLSKIEMPKQNLRRRSWWDRRGPTREKLLEQKPNVDENANFNKPGELNAAASKETRFLRGNAGPHTAPVT